MEELMQLIKDLTTRLEALERLLENREIILPPDGKLVVDNRATDPTGTNGRIYYNTTSNKFKGYEGGSWKTFTTT